MYYVIILLFLFSFLLSQLPNKLDVFTSTGYHTLKNPVFQKPKKQTYVSCAHFFYVHKTTWIVAAENCIISRQIDLTFGVTKGDFVKKFCFVSGNQFIFKVVVSLLLVLATYSKACLFLVLLFVMSELLWQAEFDQRWSNLEGMWQKKKSISHILKPTESQIFRKYISGCEQRKSIRLNFTGRLRIYYKFL